MKIGPTIIVELKIIKKSKRQNSLQKKERREPLKNNTEPESTQNSTESLSVHFNHACMAVLTILSVFTLLKKRKRKRKCIYTFSSHQI